MIHHDPDLLDALERLGAGQLSMTVFRHMFNDNPPELANTRGARWNPPGVAAIYASVSEATALAEAPMSIDSQPLRPTAARRVLYRMHVELERVVELDDKGLEAVRLSPHDVESDDWGPCQAIGAAAAWLGYDGLVVPSARSTGENVVILLNELSPDAVLERIDQREIDTYES